MRITPLLFCLAALLAGCRPSNTEEEPLEIVATSQAVADALFLEATSAGLTTYDSQGRIIPDLAQSWRVSDDGLFVVFRLRPARFADGTPVTAADIVRSLKAAQRDKRFTAQHELMRAITLISAPVDSVVEIRLSTPQPELLELLASPLLAIHNRRNVGAGAYLLATKGDHEADKVGKPYRVLKANREFYGYEAVKSPLISLKQDTADEAIVRFNRREIDWVVGASLDGYATARVTARKDRFQAEVRRSTLILAVNQKQKGLDQWPVRRALQLAINREAMGPVFFGTNAARPIDLLSPPGLADYAPSAPDWTHLPFITRQQEARRLLAQAGYDALTTPLVLSIAIADVPTDKRLFEAIARDMLAVGVQTKWVRRPLQKHHDAIKEAKFDLALIRRQSPVDSPIAFLFPHLCDRNNHGVCLPEADRLYTESWTAPTRAQRLAALAQAERLWAEDGAAIGLVQPLGWSLVEPRIEGFQPNITGVHPLRLISRNPALMPIR